MTSRLIVSLTTTPARIHEIEPALQSILAQSEPADEILLNVPFRLTRSGEDYVIPDQFRSMPGLRINRGWDYGPATKLLGALECEYDPDALIITVDDDVFYPPEMIAVYRRIATEIGDCVGCGAGFNIPDPFAFAVAAIRGSLVPVRGHCTSADVAEGFGSCLYRRSFFDSTVFELAELPDFLLYSDDICISNYLGERGIGVRTIATREFGGPGFWRYRTLPYSSSVDALHLNMTIGSNRQRYSKAIDYLLTQRRYFLGGAKGFPA